MKDLSGNEVEPPPKKQTRAEKFNDYEGFVEKFKPKKTTDDCYTPQAVYDVVLGYARKLVPTEGREIVRPFWPGGDYERYDYPEGCIVVDNPPFSILSKIVRYYNARGIAFFLFAPSLTLFTIAAGEGGTYIVADANIIYENGADVRTGFITNLTPGLRVLLDGDIHKAIEDAQRLGQKIQHTHVLPSCVVTAAQLQKNCRAGVRFAIRTEESAFCRGIAEMKRAGKAPFGGAFFISRQAAERVALAEAKAREAKAREAKAREANRLLHCWKLSAEEEKIVSQLTERSEEHEDDTI